MNETKMFILMSGIVLSIFFTGFWLAMATQGTPTEFTFNINMNHSADNNTKAIYELIEFAMKEELSDNCKVETLFWNGSDFEHLNGENK